MAWWWLRRTFIILWRGGMVGWTRRATCRVCAIAVTAGLRRRKCDGMKHKRVKACQRCGKEFEPTNRASQSYCCRQCYLDSVAQPEYICQCCGKTFRARKDRTTYCSRECAWADNMGLRMPRGIMPVWVRVCGICGKHVSGREIYCSDECRKELRCRKERERAEQDYVAPTYTCKECGQEFSPEYGSKKRSFCSDKCSHKYAKRECAHTLNQRARKVLSSIYENWRDHYQPINRGRVFKRDGYRCQLCGCKVKRTKTYHPQQATIDHIVPLSLGGAHTYANVQTCCQECNSAKGATIAGQMRMEWA